MRAGWTTKRLGEVCGIELGKTPSRAVSAYWDPGKLSDNVWLSIADLQRAEGKIVTASKEYLSDLGAALCKPVQRGTLMVSFKLTLGKLAFAGRELYTNEAIASLVILDERLISKEYLYWYLRAFDWQKAGEGEEKIKGVALNKALLRELLVSFPPLPEQRRIVALLDAAFEGLATAAANAERNLQNARDLFESHLAEVFSRRGEGWVERRLGDMTEVDSPITYGVVKPGPEGTIQFVRGGDLCDGRVRIEALRTITEEVSGQYRRTLLRGGELLICLVGQPGAVAVAPIELAGANIARQVGLVRLRSDMSADFVRLYLQSRPGRMSLGARESGSVQQVINLSELRELSVPAPSLAAQALVVRDLTRFAVVAERLSQIYEQKQAALAELKRSLLHQAFTGEL